MGFLKNLFKKKEQYTERTFPAQDWPEQITLERNHDNEDDLYLIKNPTFDEIMGFLQSMYDDADQFVILTMPELKNGIRYIQACQAPEGIYVQLGMEKDGTIKLIEKCYDSSETSEVFEKFFKEGIVDHIDTFSPVLFK